MSEGASFKQFRKGAYIALQDIGLQQALDTATGSFAGRRAAALAELPASEEMRDHFKQLRAATLGRLGHYLERFETQAKAAGAHVHWAVDGNEAAQTVIDIGKRHNVELVTKSKSMATEEIHLNRRLEAEMIQPVETDLGEWIIQLAEEPPSHIIAPAIHKSQSQVAELFSHETGHDVADDDVDNMMGIARRILRQKFIDAGMGISGTNMGIAESGTIVLVENEGNARLVTSAPKIHVVVMGIEKLARTWDDAAVWLSLLARSATGQPLSIYTSFITGPARPGDQDGPEEVHIILLDNGRSQLLGTQYEEVLQCIRCGACLNVCPVYREAGGHTYGSPYSGPIGAVVSPLLFGLDKFEALPFASTLCGACVDVCPARIDLPRMLVALRTDAVEEGLLPWHERQLESAAASLLGSERVLNAASRVGRWFQRPFLKDGGVTLPKMLDPAEGRTLPSIAPKSFRDMWRDGEVD